MPRPTNRDADEVIRNDPDESNDPKSSAGDFATHIWTSINLVFERLGEMNTKIDGLVKEQERLKTSVENHDRIFMRVIYTVGGIAIVLAILWFVYANFLKGYVQFNSAAGGG